MVAARLAEHARMMMHGKELAGDPVWIIEIFAGYRDMRDMQGRNAMHATRHAPSLLKRRLHRALEQQIYTLCYVNFTLCIV